MNIIMKWEKVDRNKLPKTHKRILTYSPLYDDENMKYRLMDVQFLRISRDVTHYCVVEEPES